MFVKRRLYDEQIVSMNKKKKDWMFVWNKHLTKNLMTEQKKRVLFRK